MKKFSYEEIRDYVKYVGDSYSYVRKIIPGDVVKIMDHFYAINKAVEEAEERYKKPSK